MCKVKCIVFSLTKKDLLALNVSLTDAPRWLHMMLAFRDVADSQSGLYDVVLAISHPYLD